MDAELAGLVARRGNDAARGRAADGHGLAAQLGIVPLLHAGEEGIHIDMMILRWRAGSSVIGMVLALG